MMREKEMNSRDTVNVSNERAKLKLLLWETEWVEVPLTEWRIPKGSTFEGQRDRENWACGIFFGRCLRGFWKHLVNIDFYISSDKAPSGRGQGGQSGDREGKVGTGFKQPALSLFSSSSKWSFVLEEAEVGGDQVLKLVHWAPIPQTWEAANTAADAPGRPLIRKGNRLPEKPILGSVNSWSVHRRLPLIEEAENNSLSPIATDQTGEIVRSYSTKKVTVLNCFRNKLLQNQTSYAIWSGAGWGDLPRWLSG